MIPLAYLGTNELRRHSDANTDLTLHFMWLVKQCNGKVSKITIPLKNMVTCHRTTTVITTIVAKDPFLFKKALIRR